jgi:tetratricopeptide (TPR) repeat protein
MSDNYTDDQDNYEDLIIAIETIEGKLSILIAVCDDINTRTQIIDRYETELQPQIKPYRVQPDRGDPSLKGAMTRLIANDPYLQNGGRAVITVTGIEELYFLKLGEERSEQEVFFGYLQWTREALRTIHYPVVLWVNNYIKDRIIKRAPDFWSWRKGVFRFSNTATNPVLPKLDLDSSSSPIAKESTQKLALNLEDLLELIQTIETQQGHQSSSLVTLYESVGKVYKNHLDHGEFRDFQQEQSLAIQYFEKAIALRRQLKLHNGLDPTLANLGSLYEAQGQFDQAQSLYLEALEILNQEGNYRDAIARLNDLAGIAHIQGHFEEAIKLYNQALAIYDEGKDTDIATYASTLNLLAGTYHAQGQYAEAEQFYQQALDLRLQKFGESHADVAVSLNNLGLLYSEQSKFGEAKSRYEQALSIQDQLLGHANPNIATTLNNLALLYYAQGKFPEAEAHLVEALHIRQESLGADHLDVAGSFNNLATLYKAQNRSPEAQTYYEKALAIAKARLGLDHAITIRFQASLDQIKA